MDTDVLYSWYWKNYTFSGRCFSKRNIFFVFTIFFYDALSGRNGGMDGQFVVLYMYFISEINLSEMGQMIGVWVPTVAEISLPALRLTQPPTQWRSFPRVKADEALSWPLTPFSYRGYNAWSFTSIPPCTFTHGTVIINMWI